MNRKPRLQIRTEILFLLTWCLIGAKSLYAQYDSSWIYYSNPAEFPVVDETDPGVDYRLNPLNENQIILLGDYNLKLMNVTIDDRFEILDSMVLGFDELKHYLRMSDSTFYLGNTLLAVDQSGKIEKVSDLVDTDGYNVWDKIGFDSLLLRKVEYINSGYYENFAIYGPNGLNRLARNEQSSITNSMRGNNSVLLSSNGFVTCTNGCWYSAIQGDSIQDFQKYMYPGELGLEDLFSHGLVSLDSNRFMLLFGYRSVHVTIGTVMNGLISFGDVRLLAEPLSEYEFVKSNGGMKLSSEDVVLLYTPGYDYIDGYSKMINIDETDISISEEIKFVNHTWEGGFSAARLSDSRFVVHYSQNIYDAGDTDYRKRTSGFKIGSADKQDSLYCYEVRLTSQSEIDDFRKDGCVLGRGSLHIEGLDIHELSELSGIESLEYLVIQNCPELTSLSGLENLKDVANYVVIYNNSGLVNFSGLDKLEHVGSLHVQNNGIRDFSGLEALRTVDERLTITHNNSLQSIEELDSLQSVGKEGWCSDQNAISIYNNPMLLECEVDFFCQALDYLPLYCVNVGLNGRGCERDTVCAEIPPEQPLSIQRSQSIEIYPNPASNLLHVRSNGIIRKISLIDFSGKSILIFDKESAGISHLPGGMYLVQIQFETGERSMEKVLIRNN